MTHVFEVPTNSYNQIVSGKQTFDILKFGRRVTVGDIVVYQRLADTEDEESEDAFTEDEVSVVIECIFDDEEKVIKKGYVAVGYKSMNEKE